MSKEHVQVVYEQFGTLADCKFLPKQSRILNARVARIDAEFLKERAGTMMEVTTDYAYYWNIYFVDAFGNLVGQAERNILTSFWHRISHHFSGKSLSPSGRSVREALLSLPSYYISDIAYAVKVMNGCELTVYKLPRKGSLNDLLIEADKEDEKVLEAT